MMEVSKRKRIIFTAVLVLFLYYTLIYNSGPIPNQAGASDPTAANSLQEFFLQTKVLSRQIIKKVTLEAVTKQKRMIEQEMENCTRSGNWKELLIENGGKPIRNVIFTTWRSGSTFLGEMIANHPATFYHYEPLLHFRIVQVHSGYLAEEGIREIKNQMNCDYSNSDRYVEYVNFVPQQHRNLRFWSHCNECNLCSDTKFFEVMCKLFPFQIMKTVRMRLKLAEDILNDQSLDVRVIFLVRDPRGTMLSRMQLFWCGEGPDCFEHKRLCSDMVDDYYSAIRLREKFPEKVMLIRYEDLSLNPYQGMQKVFKFLRLDFCPIKKDFVKVHTEKNVGWEYSTLRDSKTTPFRWISYFQNNPEELVEIQKDCGQAMDLWGYETLNASNFLNSQNALPLNKPPWKDMEI